MRNSAQKRPSAALLRNSLDDSERLESEDAEAFSAIQALLVGDELNDLNDLRTRVKDIEQTATDRDRRRDEVAEVLGDALRQASLTDGDKIEDVLNPTIGEGIRHQLKNERPAMVAALVPMVGTLVTGAMGEAVGKLSESVNQRIEKLVSFDGLRLAARAKLSGRSVNEMLLAELRNTEIERLYLFERKSEKLVFCWPQPEAGDDPSDIIAEEILRAILSFSSGMLDTGEHGLRSIAIKDRHLVLQASDSHIVVIEVSGALSDQRRGDLNDACFEVLTFISDLTGNLEDVDLDQEAMGLFAARVVNAGSSRQETGKRRISPAVCLFSVLGLALVGYIGWRAYDGYRINTRAEAIENHITASFPADSLMLSVTAERSAGTIAVLGVALSDGDGLALRTRATELAQPYALDFNLVSGNPDGAAPRLNAIEASLDTLRTHAAQTNGALQAIDTKATDAQARAEALWAAGRQLSEWTAAHAVFFSDGTSYRSEERAGSDLNALASLMTRAPERPLRIIGYSDLIGSQAHNDKLAIARGDQIAADLVARGIAPERLIVIGRTGSEKMISARNGPNSPNRRVEFQLGFVGEVF